VIQKQQVSIGTSDIHPHLPLTHYNCLLILMHR
jgi:hypothetical protein